MWYFAHSYPVNDFMPWFVYIYQLNHITEEMTFFTNESTAFLLTYIWMHNYHYLFYPTAPK